jgi:DNA-binding transcriptional LysR family regulator
VNTNARITYVNTCTQAPSWVEQGLGIALLTADMVPAKRGLQTRPVAFPTVKAVDSLYAPKEKRSGKQPESVLSPAAKAVYGAIKTYWAVKKT